MDFITLVCYRRDSHSEIALVMNPKIAVFGAGTSGQSVADLAGAEGSTVTLFDEHKAGFPSTFSSEDIENFDQYIFSPGFACGHPWRKLLEGREAVYGELGFSAERWRGRLYGVTGTNGKTTVTRLLQSVLAASGFEAIAVGNIGRPLSDLVNSSANHSEAIAVCEISSFQAEWTRGLELDGLIWTNFAEDHLDHHRNGNAYFQAKLNLLHRTKKGAPIFIGDVLTDTKSADFWRSLGAKKIDCTSAVTGALLSRDSVFARVPQSLNFPLVSAFVDALGLSQSVLSEQAESFQLDPYRLSLIAERGRLRIWQDSKSTNAHSVAGALRAMGERVFWIGGGLSKDTDISAFAAALGSRLEQVYAYGSVGEPLSQAFSLQGIPSRAFQKLEDAVRACMDSARAADGHAPIDILFSPGFASQDQFTSYHSRGKFFETIIFSLLND